MMTPVPQPPVRQVYNVLNCPKEALITPINEHWTSNDTWSMDICLDKEAFEIKESIIHLDTGNSFFP